MKAAKTLSSYSFETASSQLRKTFKSFVERLCLEKKWNRESLDSFVSCRLIPSDKRPRRGSIGVGEVLWQICHSSSRFATVMCKVTCRCWSCNTRYVWDFQRSYYECILLIDAENAFNSINRNVMLYNLKYICPVMSTYIFICYTCPVRLFIIGGCKLLSNEGKLKRIQHPISVGRLLSRHITAAAISAQFYSLQRTQL